MNAVSALPVDLDLMLLFGDMESLGDMGSPITETVADQPPHVSFATLLCSERCIFRAATDADDTVALSEPSPQQKLDEFLRERFADLAPPLTGHEVIVNGLDVPLEPVEAATKTLSGSPDIREAKEGANLEIQQSAESPPLPRSDSHKELVTPSGINNFEPITSHREPVLKESLLVPRDLPAPADDAEPSRASPAERSIVDQIAEAIRSHINTRTQRIGKSDADDSFEVNARNVYRGESHPYPPLTEVRASMEQDAPPIDDAVLLHDPSPTASIERFSPVDELSAELHNVRSSPDDLVVELSLPELGRVEIEVTGEARDTEVSLHADPALHLLIRDHLQELVSAPSESGIEFAGLDVRQQGHGGQDELTRETIGWEVPADESSFAANPHHHSAKTGLARYQLMSVTA